MVSVVVPCYNCEKYIEETINSILNQTFSNFEILAVDDLSTDNTAHILEKLRKMDKRIKYFKLTKKGGATGARNKALREAKGKYIAFLDGDDLWKPQKLEKQIKFMEDNNIYFSYTNYEKIDENGVPLNILRVSPPKINYFRMKLGDSVGCLTVMYNQEKVGMLQLNDLKKRNDFALWIKALEKVDVGYLLNENLASYRVTSNSVSRNVSKIKLLKFHYTLFRKSQNYNILTSCFYTISNVFVYFSNRLLREKKI